MAVLLLTGFKFCVIMRLRRQSMTDKVKEFKIALSACIEDVQKQHNKNNKRGGVFSVHTVYGNQYLSEKNYINLEGLYKFAKINRNLTSRQIEGLIMANANTFKFLNKYVTIVPNAVYDLRTQGVNYMANIYIEQLKAERVVDGVKKSLK